IFVTGRLSDRYGRRKPFVAAASALMGLGMFVPFFLPTLPGLIAFALVAGLGYGCYQAVDAALFTQVLPSSQNAAKDLGIANIAAHAPQVVSPVASGFVILHAGGYQALFAIAFVLSLLGALCVLPIKSVK
ncbi:MFS transporter, partial [Streptomyces sp. NPDC048428]|uniref:MFS transporter n=1 Tax=Streptomyces sp. NPDC048428 TaxID=3154503 RepID=UPI0034393E6B